MPFIAAVALLAPGSAAAAPVTVTVTRTGTDVPIPFGTQYTLKGDVDQSTRFVRPIFVRYDRRVWSVIPTTSLGCDDLARIMDPAVAIGAEAWVDAAGQPTDPGHRRLFDLTAGTHAVTDLFGVSTKDRKQIDDLGKDAVFLPETWVNTDQTKPGTFSVPIPPSGFFAPGARYCLFIYQEQKKQSDDLVKGVVAAYMKQVDACSGGYTPDPTDTCQFTAHKNFHSDLVAAIGNATTPLSAEKKDQILRVIRQHLLDAAYKLVVVPKALQPGLTKWAKQLHLPASLPENDPTGLVTPGSDGSSHLLGEALLDLLASHSAIIKKAGGGYQALDTTPIDAVGYDQVTLKTINLRLHPSGSDKPAPSQAAVAFDLATPLTPGSAVSWADLIHFARGELPWNNAYIAPSALWDQLNPILAKREQLTPADVTGLDTLQNWLDQLLSLRANAPPALKAWISALIGDGRLVGDVNQVLFDEVDAVTKVSNSEKTITVQSIGTQTYLGSALHLKGSVDQPAFFTNYLIPTVGVAFVATPEQNTPLAAVTYVAIQAYFFPNPVDDVMWSHGATDWRRMFAAELGLGVLATPLDPLKRYSGLPALGNHPLFLGAVIQPVPYATISTGVSVFMARKSALSEEIPNATAGWYFAFSLQANVFDLLRKALTSAGGNLNPVSQ